MKVMVLVAVAVLMVVVAGCYTAPGYEKKYQGSDWSIVKAPSGRCYEAFRLGGRGGSLGVEVPCP